MIDTISRADAIEAKPEYRNEDMLDKEKSTYNKGWNDCNDAWVAIIKALPSADAVQGEWIWRTDIPIGDGRTSAGYICSNCGKDYWHGNALNFCPNCGARMTPYKGGDDE